MARIRWLEKEITVFSILLLIVICLYPGGTSEEITRFSNGPGVPNIDYTLQMDSTAEIATEATGYFTIPTNRGEIKDAHLKIECNATVAGDYLTDPRLDIGLDGDYEWRYNGKGYGAAGHQTQFSTGADRRYVVTANRGGSIYDNRSNIVLPKSAQITSASLKIKGGPGRYKEDLVVGIYYPGGRIWYAKSNGNGTFGNVTEYGSFANGYAYGIGLGDFDNDNDLDIVYGQKYWSSSSNAEFFIIENKNENPHPWGNSPTIFNIGEIVTSTSSDYPYDLAVEDFDNDGNLDFITNLRSSTFYLIRGKGKLDEFYAPEVLSVSFPGTYAIGKDAADFNNDGDMDFIAGGTTNKINYYEGNGNGTFKSPVSIDASSGSSQYCVIGGDFNDDYNADILTKNRNWNQPPYRMKYVKGNGDGTFGSATNANIDFSNYYYYEPGDNFDFNYDGYQDVVVNKYYLSSSYTFYYHQGKGDGTFQTGVKLSGTNTNYYVASLAAPPRMPLGGCQNLALDLGDDGTTEKQFSGEFDTEATVDFTSALNQLLSSSSRALPVIVDEYGNEMVKIPLRFESDAIGSVLLHDLDIKYRYVATVDVLPTDRDNLTTDLNDLLPTDNNEGGEMNVYLGVYSDTPGTVRLSDLYIEYNGAPKVNNIGTIYVDEDSDTKALNLTSGYMENNQFIYYFADDYDDSNELLYGVHKNHDPEHFEFSVTEDQWLQVNCNLVPNWFGTGQVQIWCEDTDGIRTVSKEIEVNDPPIANNPLPTIELIEKKTESPIDLDDPKKEYFIDIDSDILYYRAELEAPELYAEHLVVSIDPVTYVLTASSIGSYGRNIKVRVYCHDDIELLSMSVSELALIETYQILLVNITSTQATFPPAWLPITLEPIPEDEPQENILDLHDYVTDPDDEKGNLSFSIYSLSKSGYLDVVIGDTGTLSIYPRHDFDSTAHLTLSVTDDEHNEDLTTVEIRMIPLNDLPQVEIVSPSNGSYVSGDW